MANRYGNGPTYGSQGNVQAADIAFSIHTQVDSSFYDVEYPDYEWYGILDETQVMQDINAGATSYAYITRDKHGAAAFIGNGPNDNIPKVGQSAGAVQVPVAYAAVGAVITNEDARQYDFGFNGNLAQDLGEAMRKAADNLTETSVIFGNESIGFQPWINYPGVTAVMVGAGAGAGGDTEWSTKTGIEMVRDVNAVLNAMWVNSRTIMKPLTVFIQRAVKPRPSGRGYKAHLNWKFLAFSPFLAQTLLGGWASRVSLWRGSETWGNSRLARSRKIPHCGNLKAKTKLYSSGQSR
jgi:hypothetical protein